MPPGLTGEDINRARVAQPARPCLVEAQPDGWTPAGGAGSCRWCGASAEQRQLYPRPRRAEGLEPGADDCPVCWFRFGRARSV